MQLIQFTELGGPSVLVVNSVPIPTSSFPSILIKNSFIGINYIDTYHRSGLYPVTLPYTPGREASGVIQSSTIPDFSPGDRVAYLSTNTYSEYSLLTTSDFIVKLPDSVSLQVGACLLLQGLTAMMLTHLAFKVTSKSVVLVHAANGGTGRLIIQICKNIGAKIVASTTSAEKIKGIKELGVDYVFLKDDLVKEVANIGLVDCVFDGVGKDTFECLKRHGTLLSFGNASGKVPNIDILTLAGNSTILQRPKFLEMATPFLEMVNQGIVDVKYTIYEFEDVVKAHVDLESGKTIGKLLLKV